MAEKNKKDQTGEQEQDLSQILQVRRDKLAALQAAGKDPSSRPSLRFPPTPRRSKTISRRWRASPSPSPAG